MFPSGALLGDFYPITSINVSGDPQVGLDGRLCWAVAAFDGVKSQPELIVACSQRCVIQVNNQGIFSGEARALEEERMGIWKEVMVSLPSKLNIKSDLLQRETKDDPELLVLKQQRKVTRMIWVEFRGLWAVKGRAGASSYSCMMGVSSPFSEVPGAISASPSILSLEKQTAHFSLSNQILQQKEIVPFMPHPPGRNGRAYVQLVCQGKHSLLGSMLG